MLILMDKPANFSPSQEKIYTVPVLSCFSALGFYIITTALKSLGDRPP